MKKQLSIIDMEVYFEFQTQSMTTWYSTVIPSTGKTEIIGPKYYSQSGLYCKTLSKMKIHKQKEE